MMQITVDPSALSLDQRKAVCAFIEAYPYDAEVIRERLGVPAADPLAPPLSAAPSIADATPLPIAPAVPQADSATTAMSAFGPPAQNSAPIPPAPPVALPTTPPVANVSAIVLDTAGLPWDARIHTSTKATIAGGYWRKKRNLDAALCANVEAELKVLMAGAPPPNHSASSPLPVGVGAASTPAGAPVIPAAPLGNVPPPPPLPPASVPPPASTDAKLPSTAGAESSSANTVSNVNAFVALAKSAQSSITAGKLTQAEFVQCMDDATGGIVKHIALLANRPDLVPLVQAAVDAVVMMRP